MEPTVIYPSRARAFGLMLLGIGFIAGGVAFGIWHEELEVPFLVVVFVTYLAVPLFVFSTLYLAYRLMRPKPALVIDEEGIVDHASASGVGRIRWEEISRVFTFELMGNRTIGIEVHDEQALLSRLHPVKRFLLRLNRGMTPTMIHIPASMLPYDVDELMEEVVRRTGG